MFNLLIIELYTLAIHHNNKTHFKAKDDASKITLRHHLFKLSNNCHIKLTFVIHNRNAANH